MNPNTLWMIKWFFAGCAGLAGSVGAILAFWGQLKNEKHDDTREWFRRKWEVIKNSTWLNLPERATTSLLYRTSSLLLSLFEIFDSDKFLTVCIFSIYLLFFIGLTVSFGLYTLIISLALIVILIIFSPGVKIVQRGYWIHWLLLSLFCITDSVLWILLLLRINIGYATLLMVFISPFFWLILAGGLLFPFAAFTPAESLSDTLKDSAALLILFLVGASTGFSITFVAMLIGHITDPIAYVPQTLQMLVSNVIFDGLTMVVTFSILNKALSKDGLFRLPIAIFFDIIAAVVLACGSLFFGLAFTNKALNLRQLLHVLIAKSPDGSQLELSPSFWVMHTTFIPTLLFLIFILFCWFAKAFLTPVNWFFGKGQEHKNPFALTAALLGVMGIFFSALSGIIAFTKEYLERK